MGRRISDRVARLEAEAFERELERRMEEELEWMFDKLEARLTSEEFRKVTGILAEGPTRD
jgi:hypothetical protein